MSCCSSGLTQHLQALFQVFIRVKRMLSAEIISVFSYHSGPGRIITSCCSSGRTQHLQTLFQVFIRVK